ncbi:hypothetical protein FZC33_11365 [Labrys sp. KNU-23]|uniref:DUF1565 domain-containing protein n=1 Tax=Labrys sp. KNU-23 TaxID=2789216 RepID=UPI0011ED6717|nr:DUF1565 domain-containing protein [Labrys sp. KNU-23]QEN86889.1 hypothetical protein FZC33_11365 [Labrys sp. KNU-23]
MTEKTRGKPGGGVSIGIHVEGATNVTIENNIIVGATIPIVVGHGVTGTIKGNVVRDDPKSSMPTTDIDTLLREVNHSTAPLLPAFCALCGTLFPTRNYVLAGRYLDIQNNTEPCPSCGDPSAKLSDGIYDLAGQVARILGAPDITVDRLKAIGLIIEDVRQGLISPADVSATIEQHSPELSDLWKWAIANGVGIVSLLVAAIALWFQMDSKTDLYLSEIHAELKKGRLQIEDLVAKKELRCEPIAPTQVDPASNETASKLKTDRKPKAKHLRRKAEAERRKQLRPRQRHKP